MTVRGPQVRPSPPEEIKTSTVNAFSVRCDRSVEGIPFHRRAASKLDQSEAVRRGASISDVVAPASW